MKTPWAVLLIVLWPVSLAGTDDANPYTFIGFGLHDELARWSQPD